MYYISSLFTCIIFQVYLHVLYFKSIYMYYISSLFTCIIFRKRQQINMFLTKVTLKGLTFTLFHKNYLNRPHIYTVSQNLP